MGLIDWYLPKGWSTKRRLTLLFQEWIFSMRVRSSRILNGPFSRKRLTKEEEPGPPLSQITRGSVDELYRDSKCQ